MCVVYVVCVCGVCVWCQVIKMFSKLKRSDHNSVHYSNIQFIFIHILLFKNQEYSFVLCKYRKFKLCPQAK